ncbi:MAG: 3-isopropylmalate dehydrogenase [Ignavibacteriales bacterium]
MRLKVAVLAGDGIGPEVTAQAVEAMKAAAAAVGITVVFEHMPVGGEAIEQAGEPLPGRVLDGCRKSDAVLLGAVGGPRWNGLPQARRPEAGLLALRQEMGLWANLRPVDMYPSLAAASPLRPESLAQGVNILVVRELSGGLYYGKPSECREDGSGRIAVDTMWYTSRQIERVVRLAFSLARQRRKRVLSVDKANVLACSRLWRQIVEDVSSGFPDVETEHMYVDAAAAEVVMRPQRFDVVVTENMFGDILSDLGGALVGSLGLLPSASLGDDGRGLFEPVHGSAPSLAGQDRANPLGAILSAALLFRYSAPGERGARAAGLIESAVAQVLDLGYRTADLGATGARVTGTRAMGDLIVEAVHRLAATACEGETKPGGDKS